MNSEQCFLVLHPLIADKLLTLRSEQTGSALFRQTVEELSGHLAYEALRNADTYSDTVQTPLGTAHGFRVADDQFAVVSIMRAGNGLLPGVLKLLPRAAIGYIGIRRDHATLEAQEYFCNLPPHLHRRHVIVVDPMLATGNSAIVALKRIYSLRPLSVRLLSILAAPEGIHALQKHFSDLQIYVAAIDEGLNAKGYIVPGLGDAGDRMHGSSGSEITSAV